ncbi:hypothetical protein DFJ73DRAFT_549174 [Zopfochytrium polystomum]|nr:hypothetical protein DFJ73DRAFT_549174 [Zopfochytrium polystomum]
MLCLAGSPFLSFTQHRTKVSHACHRRPCTKGLGAESRSHFVMTPTTPLRSDLPGLPLMRVGPTSSPLPSHLSSSSGAVAWAAMPSAPARSLGDLPRTPLCRPRSGHEAHRDWAERRHQSPPLTTHRLGPTPSESSTRFSINDLIHPEDSDVFTPIIPPDLSRLSADSSSPTVLSSLSSAEGSDVLLGGNDGTVVGDNCFSALLAAIDQVSTPKPSLKRGLMRSISHHRIDSYQLPSPASSSYSLDPPCSSPPGLATVGGQSERHGPQFSNQDVFSRTAVSPATPTSRRASLEAWWPNALANRVPDKQSRVQGSPTDRQVAKRRSPATPTRRSKRVQSQKLGTVEPTDLTTDDELPTEEKSSDEEYMDSARKRRRPQESPVGGKRSGAKGTEKPSTPSKYQCTAKGCGKTFTTSGHLARHKRIHAGVYPYKCLLEDCSKRFSRQDNMMQHYRAHVVQAQPTEMQTPTASSNDAQVCASDPTSSPRTSSAIGEKPHIAADGYVQLFNCPQTAAEFWSAIRSSAKTRSSPERSQSSGKRRHK